MKSTRTTILNSRLYKNFVKGKRGEAYNIELRNPKFLFWNQVRKLDISSKLMNYKGKLISRKSKDKYYLTDNHTEDAL